MSPLLAYSTVVVRADDPLDVGLTAYGAQVRIGADPWTATVAGEPADLIRLSDALRQAALRAIDAKVAAAREVAS
jgi:hypothetical protein